MGGVLIDLDVNACREAFIRDLGFHGIDEILDACHQKGIFGEMEAGRATLDEFRSYVLERSEEGHQPEEVDKALWNILVDITPEKVQLLKRLSQKYDLYMLSNNNPICTPKAAEIFEAAGYPMYEGFVKCYISYQMKALKPSAEFYQAVMTDIGLLFVGVVVVFNGFLTDYFFSRSDMDASFVGRMLILYSIGSFFLLMGQPLSFYLQGEGKTNRLSMLFGINILLFLLLYVGMKEWLQMNALQNLSVCDLMVSAVYLANLYRLARTTRHSRLLAY